MQRWEYCTVLAVTDPNTSQFGTATKTFFTATGAQVADLSDGGVRTGEALADAWARTIAELG